MGLEQEEEEVSEGRASQKPVHLLVLQHGLWGFSKNLAEMERLLTAAAEQSCCRESTTVILNATCSNHNLKFPSYDGIDTCGERLVAAVVQRIRELEASGQPVHAFSIIGYSMGGLIARYAVGRLLSLGWLGCSAQGQQRGGGSQAGPQGAAHASQPPLSSSTLELGGGAGSGRVPSGGPAALSPPRARPLRPVCFLTIATPHLGSWRLPTSLLSSTFNRLVPALASRSGAQLMINDSHALARPLLVNLCDPELPFYQALAAFQHRALMANVYNDRMVPYSTAAIELSPKYEGCQAQVVSWKYPSIVCPQPPKAGTKGGSGIEGGPEGGAQPLGCGARKAGKGEGGRGRAGAEEGGQGPGRGQQGAGEGSGGAVGQEGVALHVSAQGEQLGVQQQGQGGQGGQGGQDGSEEGPAPPHDTSGDEWDGSPPRELRRRPKRGLAFRVVFLVLMPLLLPLLAFGMLYLYFLARRHAARAAGSDHSWIAPRSVDAHKKAGGAHPAALQPPVPEKPMPRVRAVRRSADWGRRSVDWGKPSHGRRMSSAASLDEDLDVVFSDGSQMHVHEGVVAGGADEGDTTGPGHTAHQQQLWMAARLNELGWTKTDVDTRHYHAHAAIVLRDPSRFADNRDVLHYLVDVLVGPHVWGGGAVAS